MTCRAMALTLKWSDDSMGTFAGWISEAKGQYGVDSQWHEKFEDTTWETSREDDQLILQ